jgi:alpha-ketoglutarate-dependent taurine dioxygenase
MTLRYPAPWVLEITDLDFDSSLAEPEELRRLFVSYPLMIVKKQKMDHGSFLRAMETVGLPIKQKFGNSLVVDIKGKSRTQLSATSELGWHADESYDENYPEILNLYAVNIPEGSGKTHFANLHLAYTRLGESERESLKKLTSVHAFEHFDSYLSQLVEFESDQIKRMNYGYGKCVQPVVREWQRQPYLCLNHGFTTEILNEDPQLLPRLLNAITSPENVYSHTWEQGDLLFCNNHLLIHRRDSSDDPSRHLYRGLTKFSTTSTLS